MQRQERNIIQNMVPSLDESIIPDEKSDISMKLRGMQISEVTKNKKPLPNLNIPGPTGRRLSFPNEIRESESSSEGSISLLLDHKRSGPGNLSSRLYPANSVKVPVDASKLPKPEVFAKIPRDVYTRTPPSSERTSSADIVTAMATRLSKTEKLLKDKSDFCNIQTKKIDELSNQIVYLQAQVERLQSEVSMSLNSTKKSTASSKDFNKTTANQPKNVSNTCLNNAITTNNNNNKLLNMSSSSELSTTNNNNSRKVLASLSNPPLPPILDPSPRSLKARMPSQSSPKSTFTAFPPTSESLSKSAGATSGSSPLDFNDQDYSALSLTADASKHLDSLSIQPFSLESILATTSVNDTEEQALATLLKIEEALNSSANRLASLSTSRSQQDNAQHRHNIPSSFSALPSSSEKVEVEPEKDNSNSDSDVSSTRSYIKNLRKSANLQGLSLSDFPNFQSQFGPSSKYLEGSSETFGGDNEDDADEISFEELARRVSIVNRILGATPIPITTSKKDLSSGSISAYFQSHSSRLLVCYANGLALENAPFRKWTHPIAQASLHSLMAGEYPFKADTNGIHVYLEAVDRTSEVHAFGLNDPETVRKRLMQGDPSILASCAAVSQAVQHAKDTAAKQQALLASNNGLSPRVATLHGGILTSNGSAHDPLPAARRLLESLPAVMIKDGRLHNVRDAIAAKLGIDSWAMSPSKPVRSSESPHKKFIVRSDGMKTSTKEENEDKLDSYITHHTAPISTDCSPLASKQRASPGSGATSISSERETITMRVRLPNGSQLVVKALKCETFSDVLVGLLKAQSSSILISSIKDSYTTNDNLSLSTTQTSSFSSDPIKKHPLNGSISMGVRAQTPGSASRVLFECLPTEFDTELLNLKLSTWQFSFRKAWVNGQDETQITLKSRIDCFGGELLVLQAREYEKDCTMIGSLSSLVK